MYGKIFRQIYSSSIANNWKTRVVFMDLIVLADSDGIVDMTAESIAATTRYPIEMVKEAIADLEAPDAESRTSLQEGKRLIRVNSNRSWGWQIVNYSAYREMKAEIDRKSYIRNYMREYRCKKKTPHVNNVNSESLHVNSSPSPCTYRSSSLEGGTGGNEVEFPKGFPITVDDAIRDASTSPYPKQFVIDTWNRAASRGGRDHRDVPIRRWTQHLATIWGYEQSRGKGSASNETNSRNNQRSTSRNDGTYNDGVAPMYAKAAVSGMSDVSGVQDSLRPPT